jgi:hypothetical protein
MIVERYVELFRINIIMAYRKLDSIYVFFEKNRLNICN